jgi:S1-C subfamily serine protease
MNERSGLRLEIWKRRLRRARKLARRTVPFLSGVLTVLLALFLYNRLVPGPHVLNQNDVDTSIAHAMASATPPPAFSALVYQVIRPSLVIVETDAPGLPGMAADEGTGSGVIVNDQGAILTSLHIVQGAHEIQVTFADGSKSSAIIANTQPENDIAVLQARQLPEEFVAATLGNPNAMRIGDEAYVVGNPFSLYNSMTSGVISGFDRTFQIPDSGQRLENLIQVDAAVNPGNSGGPLVNRAGQVVGIVTALLNPNGQNVFVGVGFAVPITTAGGAAGSPPV